MRPRRVTDECPYSLEAELLRAGQAVNAPEATFTATMRALGLGVTAPAALSAGEAASAFASEPSHDRIRSQRRLGVVEANMARLATMGHSMSRGSEPTADARAKRGATDNSARQSAPQATSRMTRFRWILGILCTIWAGSFTRGCTPGHVGDPCVPEDEYNAGFSGFSEAEANVESRSFQCDTRVCISNHFRGRVSCPYGQTRDFLAANADKIANGDTTPDPGVCYVPGSDEQAVKVPVEPQLLARRAEDTVYCSCRCDGPDKSARYCTCPSGFSCLPLVPELGLGQAQLVGSYCLKDGTRYDGTATSASCSLAKGNCPSEQAKNPARNPPP